MKKINPLLLTILTLTFFTSCSNKWHIVRRENKMNNLTHWKQDRIEKQEAKKVEKLKENLTKLK